MTTVVLVLAVIVIVLGAPLYNLANSLHEQHRASVELAQARAEKTELTTELNRWSDPDYISAQARERLGYVKPGETATRSSIPAPAISRARRRTMPVRIGRGSLLSPIPQQPRTRRGSSKRRDHVAAGHPGRGSEPKCRRRRASDG
ncbi:septum formation initiator family protein [Nanchangia anserum]|uniref:FtsB family cell division protein n=1 Tax=Nanchangia anserum TaxID=2692125 RepID=UPI001883B835|nr:septum formation initiator family protein [Nanchangia anserum]QOX82219.1 septum formation initiator family protein [Nanchangia anserum]